MTDSRPSGVKGILTLLLAILTLVYPLVVYLYAEHTSPRWYGGLLLVVVAIRFIFLGNLRKISNWLMIIVAITFCCLIIFFDSQLLLKFYPVLMNIGMGLMFIISLYGSQSLIETFAKVGGKTPPPQARGYLRALSLCWGVLLLLNGAISAYTALLASLSVWAVYNGIVSYLIIGGFVIMELGYRSFYKKRHNIVDE